MAEDMLDTQARGRVVFIGWEEASEDLGHDRRFIAKVEFPAGPPNWPMGVVWGDVPVTIALDGNGTKQEDAS